eukprot:TRINITY_DN1121_c0_g1_i1.p1 TRINITY_DN1121_c0_g1~~TRINITY_DN1121_c0_g1_i1.p1  ORF type:complete len:273 (+),score=50.17 TRINITY_DN1121_c0_g1_i1:45-863(+)
MCIRDRSYYLQIWSDSEFEANFTVSFKETEPIEILPGVEQTFSTNKPAGDDVGVYTFDVEEKASVMIRATSATNLGQVLQLVLYNPEGEKHLAISKTFSVGPMISQIGDPQIGTWTLVLRKQAGPSGELVQKFTVTLGRENCVASADFGICSDSLVLEDGDLVWTEFDADEDISYVKLYESLLKDVRNDTAVCQDAAREFFCASQIPICDQFGNPTKTMATCDMCEEVLLYCDSSSCFAEEVCHELCNSSSNTDNTDGADGASSAQTLSHWL